MITSAPAPKCFLKDMFASKQLLLNTASRYGLSKIHTEDAVITFQDEETTTTTTAATPTNTTTTTTTTDTGVQETNL